MSELRCPCGQGGTFDDCCGPVLRGERAAATAAALMRSRYTAFAVADVDYLLRSWHPRTRPPEVALDPARRWLFLEVRAAERGGLFDDTGTVEFVAHYRDADGRGALHEVSRFARFEGAWVYLDGTHKA
ncbi:YchJ family metal-binding protein [Nocardia sp. NPDC023852]|uniref:YchJ family protein n=1 Tax=Nocardia sp. NPDC023852 TaxID=3154697 RepID=UPI0033D9C357